MCGSAHILIVVLGLSWDGQLESVPGNERVIKCLQSIHCMTHTLLVLGEEQPHFLATWNVGREEGLVAV